MNNNLKRFADKFVKDIREENAAIFAGSGLSVGAGYMNWKSLLSDIALDLDLDIEKENDLIAIAQYYKNENGGRGSINAKLIEEFTKDTNITSNHKILASLPIRTYWTTNYDRLIEKSLEEIGKVIDVKICPENLAVNIPRKDASIYKMHGDITLPHEAVITKDDYETYNNKRQVFTTALQGDLITKTFLFIGFSFDDPNLEYILGRIRVLLGENTREHYCFFREIKQEDYQDNSDYLYAKTKQQLKIKDLKRYSIKALLIDNYSEITEFLELVNAKIKRKNIFISGAAVNYGTWDADKLVYSIAKEMSKNEYKIISGFGLGIGSSVINGVLSHVYSKKKLHIDDYLILRPFPQNISSDKDRKKLWSNYRQDMISESGIALFLFGNKEQDGKLITSNGMVEEFEIAIKMGVKVVPIGCTGFVAEELWNKVMNNYQNFLPDSKELIDTLRELGRKTITIDEIVTNTVKIVNLLQNDL